MKEKIKLSGVPETMLQTVYARAKESNGRGAIHDAKAEELIEKLDYDFSLADKETAMRSGVIARTIVLDKLTKSWLGAHPGAVVVNIACGLDTRCYRMSGYAHWYNLDLPETMAVREKLLPESGSISQIAMSAMDDWGGEIGEQNVPVLIVIEGLSMYLNTKDVQRIFAVISSRFKKATVFAETMNREALQGKIHRGQPCKIHLGNQEWENTCRTAVGFSLCGGTQLNRGHGGICASLQAAGQAARRAEYFQ